jgi:N-methylhydantoinase A/oxoprolinase/acetone carboxylase beta subunit
MANKVGKTVSELLEMVLSSFTKQLCISCLQSIAEFEDQSFTLKENAAAIYFINKALETKQHELLATSFTVSKPIVAIGAPVAAWMPAVCNKLNTELIIPEHAEVANAVGAAVGQVVQTIEAIIRPEKGHEGYILHAPWERKVFDTLEEALEYSIPAIKQHAANLARDVGSGKFEVVETHKDFYIETAGVNKKIYIETVIRATAIGSPIWVS